MAAGRHGARTICLFIAVAPLVVLAGLVIGVCLGLYACLG